MYLCIFNINLVWNSIPIHFAILGMWCVHRIGIKFQIGLDNFWIWKLMPNHNHKVEKYEKLGSNLHPKKCQNCDWRFFLKGITSQHLFKDHHAIHDNKNVCFKNWDWHFMHYFSYPPWCPWIIGLHKMLCWHKV